MNKTCVHILKLAKNICLPVLIIFSHFSGTLQFHNIVCRGDRKKEFEVLMDICHDGVQVFERSKRPKCTPLMGKNFLYYFHESNGCKTKLQNSLFSLNRQSY
jgi:hypothetical protein